MTFEILGVKPEIVRALNENGIETPTMIQEKAIPLIKSGKDVIGRSKTGSGKTLAFGIPILENVVKNGGVQALILAPTRELALQISEEIGMSGKYVDCSITTVYGGVPIGPQVRRIAQSEIIVGTPGRLLDHIERRTINLSRLKCFVLDEADKMVDMGFIRDIERILGNTPKNKQMLLFGATISGEIEMIKKRHMKMPETTEAEAQVKEDLLEQYYYNVEQHEKFSLLVHLLNKEDMFKAIVFCSKISTVELVAKNLSKQGIRAEMIHGKLSQNRRTRVIDSFADNKVNVLVASPVAARGLDIKDVTHVFNYDLSPDPQEYIHRIGRTARAGESGRAITILCHRDYEAFNSILRRYRLKVGELPREDFQKVSFDARGAMNYGRQFGNSNRDRGFPRGSRGSWRR